MLAIFSTPFSITGPLGLTATILLIGFVSFNVIQGIDEMSIIHPQYEFLWLIADHELELREKCSHGCNELSLAFLQPSCKWITKAPFEWITFSTSSKGPSHNPRSKLRKESSLKRQTGILLLVICMSFLATTTMNFTGNNLAATSDCMAWQSNESSYLTEERDNRYYCGFWKGLIPHVPLDLEPGSQICPAEQHMVFRDFSHPTVCHSDESEKLSIYTGALDLCPFRESQIAIGNHDLEESDEAEKLVSLTVDEGIYAAVETDLKVTHVWGNEASPTHAERDFIDSKMIAAIQRPEDSSTPTALLHPTTTTLGGTTVVLSDTIGTSDDNASVTKPGFRITSLPSSPQPRKERRDQVCQNTWHYSKPAISVKFVIYSIKLSITSSLSPLKVYWLTPGFLQRRY